MHNGVNSYMNYYLGALLFLSYQCTGTFLEYFLRLQYCQFFTFYSSKSRSEKQTRIQIQKEVHFSVKYIKTVSFDTLVYTHFLPCWSGQKMSVALPKRS